MTLLTLPEKTIERLSKYRRCLHVIMNEKKTHVYSHELAKMLNLTPVQIRRDIMLIGHSGTLRKGYDVRKLNDLIGKIIESTDEIHIAIIGLGNLGKAIMDYIQGKSMKLSIHAAFDVNPEKTDRLYKGIPCFHINELQDKVKQLNITVAILTTPTEVVQDVADKLIVAGIKGVLNYTTSPLHLPSNIYHEEYDMITSLEKVAYFVKSQS
jgi:redox-sensing transcriptional repressor